MNWLCMPNKRTICLVWISMLVLGLCACDGGTPDAPPKAAGYAHVHNWARLHIATFDASGTTQPHVVARPDGNGSVHMAYYNAETSPDDIYYHQLHHLVWNPRTNGTTTRVVRNRPAPTGVNGFDRCDQFDMAVPPTGPVFVYPTYEIDARLQYIEADVMVNRYLSGTWNEDIGAIGFVPRNPEYTDGHVTQNMSMVIDSNGGIHFAYQYYTEGMDSANFRYPDIYYTYRDPADLATPMNDEDYEAIEEQVDGNQFSTYGVHNSVGYQAQLLLDLEEELPIIIYGQQDEFFNGTFALKAAFRDADGNWQRETIENLDSGWTVSGISAAFYPPDPEDPEAERPLAVAYGIKSPAPEPDDSHRLMFAVKREGRWEIEIVDETTWCGADCSLAFTPGGNPAIAYFDEQSHSGRPHHFLKYAEFNGIVWRRESADEEGLVGRSNTLWFDDLGRANICTFGEEDNEILVIRQHN